MRRLLCMISIVTLLSSCSDDGGGKPDAGPDLGGPDQRALDLAGADAPEPDGSPNPDQTIDAPGPVSAWTEMPSGAVDPIQAIWGAGPGDVHAVGKNGLILHYDGTSWSKMASPQTNDLYAVWGVSATEVYAAGDEKIATYNGTKWVAGYEDPAYDIRDLWSAPGSSTIWAVGKLGGNICYKSGAGDPTGDWSAVYLYTTTSASMYGIWGASDSEIYAVGDGGLVLKCSGTCTSVSSWSIMTTGVTTDLRDIWGFSSSDIFAVGLNGVVLHYDGTTWSKVTTGSSSYFHGVWGSSPTDVFAVGNPVFAPDEAIFRHDGSSWTKLPPPKSVALHRVWGSSATDVFAVGNFTILHFDGTP